jgi:hypothetical protein
MRFRELVRLLEKNGFRLVKEKGSIRYDGKAGLDYHAAKEVPTGTCCYSESSRNQGKGLRYDRFEVLTSH